jgi:molecular chaperone GrpE
MVQTLLRSALERHGLQEIDANDQAFDPARHEAVAVEQKPGVDAGRVLRVLMPGYLLTDRVLRHAKVVVSGK